MVPDSGASRVASPDLSTVRCNDHRATNTAVATARMPPTHDTAMKMVWSPPVEPPLVLSCPCKTKDSGTLVAEALPVGDGAALAEADAVRGPGAADRPGRRVAEAVMGDRGAEVGDDDNAEYAYTTLGRSLTFGETPE